MSVPTTDVRATERADGDVATTGSTTASPSPWLPPRPIIHLFWFAHRAIYRITGGRRGLRMPKDDGRFGMLRLRTVGRRSGRERSAILGYHVDGANLVTLAMNGWGEGEPAWWLNLLAHPDAVVDMKEGPRPVRAREAVGAERERLWQKLHDDPAYGGDLDAYANLRSGETAVVVLEPR